MTWNPPFSPEYLTRVLTRECAQLREKLPALLKSVQAAGQTVTWICDPMHGNTESCEGYKTRRYDNIRAEVGAAPHCILTRCTCWLILVFWDLSAEMQACWGLCMCACLQVGSSVLAGVQRKLKQQQSLTSHHAADHAQCYACHHVQGPASAASDAKHLVVKQLSGHSGQGQLSQPFEFHAACSACWALSPPAATRTCADHRQRP